MPRRDVFCEDEGCPHFGMPHYCYSSEELEALRNQVTAERINSSEFPRLKQIDKHLLPNPRRL